MKHLLTATILAAGLASTPALADVKLTYGSWAPDTDPASIGMEAFSKEVSEASGGSVTFDNLYGGQIVQMRTVLPGIGEGLVDAGYVASAIYQAEMPIGSMITNYASIQSNPFAISAAVNEAALLNCPDCVAEDRANGLTTLAYAGTPHFYLMCKNPISSFKDLEGKSVRAASANLRLAKLMGATPVNTPTTEVLEAMSRGQVECAIGSVFWLQAYSLWDEVGYVLDLPVGQYNNGNVFAMSTEVWDGLGADDKAAIKAGLPTLVAEAAAAGVAKAKEVRAASIDKGVVWGEPTDEMRAFLDDWFKSEAQTVRALGSEKGIANADAIATALEKSVAKWNKVVEDAGGDKDAIRERMQTDIFSKL